MPIAASLGEKAGRAIRRTSPSTRARLYDSDDGSDSCFRENLQLSFSFSRMTSQHLNSNLITNPSRILWRITE